MSRAWPSRVPGAGCGLRGATVSPRSEVERSGTKRREKPCFAGNASARSAQFLLADSGETVAPGCATLIVRRVAIDVKSVRCLIALLMALWCVPTAVGAVGVVGDVEPEDWIGDWAGEVELSGASLGYGISLTFDATSGWSGTMSIPAQGLDGFPLESIEIDADFIEFGIAVPGDPTWSLKRNGDVFVGTLRQSGQTFPATLARGSIRTARPQEPTEPFDYEVREVTFPSLADGVVLSGTLTVPKGDGPFPAVALVSGSGPSLRDQVVAGHRPFLVLADRLTRGGVAVLRYDDRGVGESTGDYANATSEDFALDARGAVAFLKGIEHISSDGVGLVGHSEGGLIAPLAAVDDDDIAFIVLLAGPGATGRDVLVTQLYDQAFASGDTKAVAKLQADAMAAMLDPNASDDAELANAEALLRSLSALDADAKLPDSLADTAKTMIAQFDTPWMRYFIAHDPIPVLKRVEQPVLALFGEKDRQVNASANAIPMRRGTVRQRRCDGHDPAGPQPLVPTG